jgi:hypothetical protein
MQKMLFEKLGVGQHSKANLQACEIVHKLPMHKGLQSNTPVGLENVVDEVYGVQNNEVALLLVNQTLPHNGNTSDTCTLGTYKCTWINISKVLSMVHEVPL